MVMLDEEGVIGIEQVVYLPSKSEYHIHFSLLLYNAIKILQMR